jgi:hypothetical protein
LSTSRSNLSAALYDVAKVRVTVRWMRSVDASFSMHRLRLLLGGDDDDDVVVSDVGAGDADVVALTVVLGLEVLSAVVGATMVAGLVMARVDDGVLEPDLRVRTTTKPDTTSATTTTPITARTVRLPPERSGPPAPLGS